MVSTRLFGVALLAVAGVACGHAGDEGNPGVGGAGTAASGGASGATMPVNKAAISLELSETTCVSQTSWAFPDAAAPVTATQRGTPAVDQGPSSDPSARCLVQLMTSGKWDIAGAVTKMDGASSLSVNAFVVPGTPTPGGFQLLDPIVREDISSNKAGPCLFTLMEVSEGNAWGKVECATTHERDMTECGAAVLYFAFQDCYTDRAKFLGYD